jgi:beta-glucosidase/6-phospho-beta-glucosidase/beta-galactosidase
VPSFVKVGKSCNFWEFYADDIRRNADMNCNALRFSLEWNRIEPKRGEINQEAISKYHKILDELERYAASHRCVERRPQRSLQ